MMEDKIVRQYVRAVSRKLICSKATRSKLLNGLKQELSAYSELSYNELCAKVGNPEQIAEQLLESVDETEIAVSKRKHRFVITLVIGILIVLLLLLAAYYIHAQLTYMHSKLYAEISILLVLTQKATGNLFLMKC